ncbi:Development-specific protein LVN1.2 [Holothuria leucospilota]|uniref:Development-specific protein LVN1.2 n=1 Tax=Holothuria leucospilota TaxID=206669 RepID=A0A9Q1BQD6_HOLLE|nr:Development-specific protein LVN1.2 [Holothuria leucospilota]
MKIKMHAIAICVFLSLVVASNCYTVEPKKCCFDEEFEGFYGGSIGSVQGGSVQGINELLQFAYDFKERRYGTDGDVKTSEGLSIRVKTIQLWKENKQYTIVNGVCTMAPLVNGSEPTRCIPANATFLAYLFEGKNEIDLQSWQGNISSVDMNATSTLTVSNKTCAPVGTSFTGSINNGGEHELLVSNGGFFNLTSGVKDPKIWFGIPQSCQHNFTNVKIRRDEVAESVINLLRKTRFLSFQFY